MPYTPQSCSASVNAFARRFIGLLLIWMLCAILAYSAAAFLLPVSPQTVFGLAPCDTPATTADWLRLCTDWLSGVTGQLLFVFLGTTGAFSVWFGGILAIWQCAQRHCFSHRVFCRHGAAVLLQRAGETHRSLISDTGLSAPLRHRILSIPCTAVHRRDLSVTGTTILKNKETLL